MDIVNFIKILLRRKLILFILPVIAIIITYFLVKNLPDVYKSTAQLATGITDESQLSITAEGQALQQFDIQNKFGNLIELMKSKKVIDLVGFKLLKNDLSTSKPFREPSKLMLTLNQEAKTNVLKILDYKIDSMQSLTNAIADERGIIELLESMKYDYNSLLTKMKVEREGSSDFIKVEFESENADLSAFVVNTEILEFIRYFKKLTAIKSDVALNYFADLAEQKKQELDAKIDDLKRYKMANGVINLYEQTKALVDQKSELELAREQQNKNIPALKEAIDLIDNKFTGKEKLYFEADARPYNERIVSLKDRIKVLTDEYITKGLDDKDIENQLIETKKQLEAEITIASDKFLMDPNAPKDELVVKRIEYELDLEISRYAVQSMDKELGRLNQLVMSFAPKEAEISAYEREITVAQDVYLMILNKYNLARFDNMNLVETMKQTEFGEPANKPEASKKMLTVILAGVVSLLMSVVLIFVLEYIDQTLKSPKQFTKITNLELLGNLNRVKKSQINLKDIFSESQLDPESELFRQLLRSMRYSLSEKLNGKKFLLTTSTEDNTGKTLVISCLAYSFALIGKKVLIIDTNFSHNSLTINFGASPSLEDFLEDLVSVDNAISKTSMNNIDVVGCRGGSYSPDELGGLQNFKNKIVNLTHGYDLVMMEGAALNKHSDAKELSNISDLIIAVFSANSIVEDSDKYSIDALISFGDKFAGAVLNNLSTEYLEEVYGDIAKKRSWFRKYTKKIVKRNLSQKKLKDTQVS
ncbi:MAG TPA: Wzz/FepE/Etk N-terminal domain-containing protein [Ignavibacteria bacterium]|nr:Wzz/FepE/Etk N-terminal domain-containing protein [Ignavibacteria bacterium]